MSPEVQAVLDTAGALGRLGLGELTIRQVHLMTMWSEVRYERETLRMMLAMRRAIYG